MRPKQWAHFALLPLACFEPTLPGALALARGVAIAACVLAYGYLLNAISDRKIDRSLDKNPLAVEMAID